MASEHFEAELGVELLRPVAIVRVADGEGRRPVGLLDPAEGLDDAAVALWGAKSVYPVFPDLVRNLPARERDGLIGALVQAAFTWAHTNGATKIFLGICENPGPPAPQSGTVFPEYSRDFALLCRHLYAVGAPDRAITLETPLIDMNGADIIRLGRRLKAPFELTWSCYEGGALHCGQCGTCVERREAFHLAGVPDPTRYVL